MQFGRKAVSPLIATVLVTLLSVVMLGTALGVVNPTFRRAQDTSAVNDQFSTLQTLNAAVKEVASEPDGSRRIVPITVTAGTLRVNSTYDWLYFEYEPSEAMDISGIKGDIRIEHGLEFADYFNYYADGSKATPTWTNTSGQWIVSGGAYSGTNGTSYHNVSGPLENWKFGASISNASGTTGGQIFVTPTNPERLVGFWTFDEGTGSKAYDWSGNSNNGTIYGATWVDGKYGKALNFTSSNYVEVPRSESLDVDNEITISVWVYKE